jgi:hypothetical protein
MNTEPKHYYRHDGWGGHECGFCGKLIKSLPYVIVGNVDKFEDGNEHERGTFDAHKRCAKKMGLKEMDDEAVVGTGDGI